MSQRKGPGEEIVALFGDMVSQLFEMLWLLMIAIMPVVFNVL